MENRVSATCPPSRTRYPRLRQAGLALAEVRENIATGSDAEAIHAALMRSPAHRQNILAPHVTHVGIGVRASTAAAGSR